MSTLQKKFGFRLRQLRRTKNLTQEQLAEKLTISVKAVSNIERGINAPSFKTLEILAQILGVEVRDLFDFQGSHD